jgi:RimJ/RimL family protein N-acetyltransferase
MIAAPSRTRHRLAAVVRGVAVAGKGEPDAVLLTYEWNEPTRGSGGRVTVRWPTVADAPAFEEMHHTLRDEEVMARRITFPSEALGTAAEYLTTIVADNASRTHAYVVAEHGGRLVGEAFISHTPERAEAPAGTAVTLGICIVEAAANLGLGTRLMRLMEVEARAMGARKMTLGVWEANGRAVHVYEKLGYKVTKIVQRDDAHGRRVPDGASTNLLEMWLTLSGGADRRTGDPKAILPFASTGPKPTAAATSSAATTADAPPLPSPRQPPTVLTPAQVAHFDAFGYAVAMGGRVIQTLLNIFHLWFSIQNILSGIRMTPPPMARFVVLPGHLLGSVAKLQADVDVLHTAARGGAPFDAETGRQSYEPLFEMQPSMHHWLDDDRFYGVAADLLGPQPILNASEGNRHVADTHWHGGLPDEEPASYTACPEYRGNVKIAWCVTTLRVS